VRRREFITLVRGAASWPLAARAQQVTKTYHIALVHPSRPISEMSESGGTPFYAAFFKELRRLGYIEGVNLVELGALMVYSQSAEDSWSRLPVYIDQILKGAHSGDLPIYLESKFDLLINLKTAKAKLRDSDVTLTTSPFYCADYLSGMDWLRFEDHENQ